MVQPPRTEERLRQVLQAYKDHPNNKAAAARSIKMTRPTFNQHLIDAARRGMMLDHAPAMPGFRVTRVNDGPSGQSVEQKPDRGDVFKVPDGHLIKGVSAFVDPDGREIGKWIKTREDHAAQQAAMQAVVAALSAELPRIDAVPFAGQVNEDLLNQYTITDLHLGMLSWREESGADYDLKIAEQLLLDWFAQAIKQSPDAATAILAQLGDLLHFDSLESVTPTHRHILDADSRFAKIVRIVIHTMRRVIAMLLEKHARVHVIMADANHDPASEIWLREMFAAFYEKEPRLTVDRSASTYYAYEFGLTGLFYHHGHRKKIGEVDRVFVSRFAEMYGRTKYRFGHVGHRHSDEALKTKLMKIEQHETLAAPDAYAAQGGYPAMRSAKVITYHKQFGEVGRIVITPEMVTR